MTRDELELMWDLKRINSQTAAFVLEFMGGDMPADKEIAFARQLAFLAERFMEHAKRHDVLTVEVVEVRDGTALELPAGEIIR